MLKSICDAVDAAAHVQIAIVTGFGGIAAKSAFAVQADHESARTVLIRALGLVSPDASWAISHDEGNKYFLMLTSHPVRRTATPAAPASQQHQQQLSPASTSH
jgi:hypothetical protein